jgi:hypothetical protein
MPFEIFTRNMLWLTIFRGLDQESKVCRVRDEPTLSRLDRVGQALAGKHLVFQHAKASAV